MVLTNRNPVWFGGFYLLKQDFMSVEQGETVNPALLEVYKDNTPLQEAHGGIIFVKPVLHYMLN